MLARMLPPHVFSSAETSLRQTLAEEGLEAASARILEAALPALMLVPQRTAPKTFASQIGGDPWLPTAEWPHAGAAPEPAKAAKGKAKAPVEAPKVVKSKAKPGATVAEKPAGVPYGLVAQIPIRDLPRIPGIEFPPRGTFWFYVNEKAEAVGHALGRVLHSEMLPADLAVRPRPDGAPLFPARAVRYEPILTLPLPGSKAHSRLKLRGTDAARYARAVDKNCAAHSGVQLFGHPSGALKGDLFEPLMKAGGGKETDYVLLFQIEGKSELGWSKAGTLYFVLKRDALAKGQLDKASTILVR
jgi:uncharacterized protein YwqG